jgi:hypothetical protein
VKVLVAGWFSFPSMGATAGDLLSRQVVCRWLEEVGRAYDIAVAPPVTGGVDWQAVDPGDYSDVLFVCGPFGNGWPIPEFLARFSGKRLIGLNLSMLQPIDVWNPFDLLLERDSSRTTRPDLALLAASEPVPVAGIVLIAGQPEYQAGRHEQANRAIHQVVASRDIAAVAIDTRLDLNETGLRTERQVESLIARMDVVVTTRLHGLVLALKNGVPVVAVDPVDGGAKVLRQAKALGWPSVLTPSELTHAALNAALDWALGDSARQLAAQCRVRAHDDLIAVHAQFISAFRDRAPAPFAGRSQAGST